MTGKKRLPLSSSATSLAASASSSLRRHFWFGLKAVGSASVLFCVLTILRIQSQSQPPLSPSTFYRQEKTAAPFEGPRKVAFLFLARSALPLDFIWHAFFQNGNVGSFSIHIHSKPGFVFDESTTRSPFFYGRQLRDSVQVAWGESSMIKAERLLLKAALEDPANQRFVLLSDSCIPLYNFSYVYDYLMSSSKSFIDSFLDAKEGRYNPKMFPTIPEDKWRKGSQWATLTKKHAEVVVSDDIVFPVFRRYCKRRPALDLKGKRRTQPVVQKEHNCIPDEHYMQTLFSMSEMEGELERRTLTYSFWNQSKSEMESQRWHPITFKYADASPQRIKKIKVINHVYYETEHRTEWCQCSATSVSCFLFARKFSTGAAMRLLSEGLVGPFDTATLLSFS